MLALMILDQWWWLAVPGLLLGFYAQMRLRSTYGKYSRVGAASGITGAGAAREILDRAGLHQVPIAVVPGHLTDHYDPRKRALFLSADNYHGHSLAAIGVAAHEAGHALQHQAAYGPLHLRMWLVPATQFATTASYFIVLASFVIGLTKLAMLGVGIFAVTAFFQLVTLPVEFDASRRAKKHLQNLGLITPEERVGVSRVLSAAAMTYVAAMITAVLELIHWVLIARSGDRD